MRDNTVIKGTVIQITESMIEFDPEGPATFDSVSKDRVARIVYSNGREQRFLSDMIIIFL